MKKQLLVASVLVGLLLLGFSGSAWAKQPSDAPPVSPPLNDPQPATAPPVDPLLGLSFAQVAPDGAPLYHHPGDTAPARMISKGFVFIDLTKTQTTVFQGELWYQLATGEYIPAKYLTPYAPSQFRGLEWLSAPTKAFAWVLADTRVSLTPGTNPEPEARRLTRYQTLVIQEEQMVDAVKWYRIGKTGWVSQYRVAVVTPSPRPERVGLTDKWIEVNLYEQTLAAYEGDTLVYATLISSGLPGWETDQGLFRIWSKARLTPMSGHEGAPDFYSLDDVMWTQFFNNDTALHGAYWHDGFGAPHSHGCVNLSPQDALWLYEWTTPPAGQANWAMPTASDPGTWVWVHE
ncbi:MAG: L,D-transpeptidase [Anaerolineae bacterium]